MTGLIDTWNALTLQRRIIVGAAAAATVVLMLLLARTAAQPEMRLLYGGLDERASGEIVAALDQMGVANEVRGGGIYVPSNERERARLDLARQGLPQQGQAGYELLDGLSGFGTTSEMFQATYWRSKEGELARTILAVPGVRAARVHIGQRTEAPFARQETPATAAVTVTMDGGRLPERAAMSIRFLVALAVPGLDPEQVAVIDADAGVVLGPNDDGSATAEGVDPSAELEKEIRDLLAPHVGADNVRVSASVETSSEQTTISERVIDPESRIAVSEESEALTENSTGAPATVTVASNLPDGDAQGGEQTSAREQTRDRVAYEFSELRREAVTPAGVVERIGVAVLINDVATVNEAGETVYTTRSPAELADIEELVRSAIAFDAERGDVITVKSMPFVATPEQGVLAQDGFELFLEQNLTQLIQFAVLAVAMLILALFVVRPILTARPAGENTDFAALGLEGEGVIRLEGGTLEGGAGQVDGDGVAALTDGADIEPLPDDLIVDKPDDSNLITVLRESVIDRTEDAANQLRNWLNAEAQTRAEMD